MARAASWTSVDVATGQVSQVAHATARETLPTSAAYVAAAVSWMGRATAKATSWVRAACAAAAALSLESATATGTCLMRAGSAAGPELPRAVAIARAQSWTNVTFAAARTNAKGRRLFWCSSRTWTAQCCNSDDKREYFLGKCTDSYKVEAVQCTRVQHAKDGGAIITFSGKVTDIEKLKGLSAYPAVVVGGYHYDTSDAKPGDSANVYHAPPSGTSDSDNNASDKGKGEGAGFWVLITFVILSAVLAAVAGTYCYARMTASRKFGAVPSMEGALRAYNRRASTSQLIEGVAVADMVQRDVPVSIDI